MATYRDPDDMPVDPDADDEQALTSTRRAGTLWRLVDPDADRPARLADDDDLVVIDADPSQERAAESMQGQ